MESFCVCVFSGQKGKERKENTRAGNFAQEEEKTEGDEPRKRRTRDHGTKEEEEKETEERGSRGDVRKCNGKVPCCGKQHKPQRLAKP